MGLCLSCPVVPTYSKTHSAVAHTPTEATTSPACVTCDCPHSWNPLPEERLSLPVFGCLVGGVDCFPSCLLGCHPVVL